MIQQERINIVIGILYVLREVQLGRKVILDIELEKTILKVNSESLLTILVAPDIFLEVQNNKEVFKQLKCMGNLRSKEEIWSVIRNDIKRMFPGRFTDIELGYN
jgi:hypothetical protein